MADKTRINLVVPQTVKNRIERLMVATEADTMTEVIKRALVIMEALAEVERHGGSLIVETADGDRHRLIIV